MPMKDGRQSYAHLPCSKCERTRDETYFTSEWTGLCKECKDACNAARDKLADRRQKQTVRYGVSVEFLEDLREAQGHMCPICEESLPDETDPAVKAAHVDHDHDCGPHEGDAEGCENCIRGVLHSRCNNSPPQNIQQVINWWWYIEAHRQRLEEKWSSYTLVRSQP